MARQSSDREDLMAEAITLSPRVSCLIPEHTEEIVAGRRADGRWSVFFGGDPVYHFDANDRLRRAFVRGHLYRSQGTTLARLTRQETPAETVLLRHDLEPAELNAFLLETQELLAQLAAAHQCRSIRVLQSIPGNADFLLELAPHLEAVLNSSNLLAPALKK